MSRSIVVVGSPTALGGHFPGMDRTPGELRARGFLERLAERPGLTAAAVRDAGDVPIEPGWQADPDRRAKNRDLIVEALRQIAAHVAAALLGPAGRDGQATPGATRLLALGGDCTTHAGVLAGLRRATPGLRVGLVWFDAHGDFNTPDTTPSGNVWGMPFAMACGRGDPALLAACDAPSVHEEDAALLGGQVLDEIESRSLAASHVAHFGTGMLSTPGGSAALAAWARTVGSVVDGFYIAFDADCLDAADDWAVAMPEPEGLTLDTAITAVRSIAAAAPVLGFGATAVMFGAGDGPKTIGALAELAEAAFVS